MRSIEEFPNNPFLPSYPIYPNNFVGRKDEIEIILRYLPRVINQGIPEHFFITGKREKHHLFNMWQILLKKNII